jgi:murein L,D-transpeptidase YafK
VDAPLPPRRPADFASREAPPAAPLPPARPADLAMEAEAPPSGEPAAAAPLAASPPVASPPAQEPAAAEPAVANVPLPPTRPRALAALTPPSAAVPDAPPALTVPVAPAAPAAQQLAAHTEEPALRPAPPEVFSEPSRPARFNMGAPAYVRIFKKEGELELWLRVNGRYSLYRTFPICKWSGRLGPKVREADYQSPEGFYSVSARQLNPHSNYHLAFNVGYPNAFDRQNGHTGGLVMVHGNCKSVGCFAMTDKGIDEIYGFVAAALSAGQREVPVHIFPFRMTEAAIARETGGGGGFLSFFATDNGNGAQWAGFWRNLKEGYDLFHQTGEPPTAYACGDHYAFGGGAQDGSCKRVAGW